MKIAFFGTPDFAAHLLTNLIESGYCPVCVVTQVDKPQGRSSNLVPPPVKNVALAHNIPLLQPVKASDPEFLQKLGSYKPDLLVVVAYGQILRQPLLDLAPQGAINVHTSLLPHLRGAAPMQWALIRGDAETGVTIMKMSLGMDEGDILLQLKLKIDPEWNMQDLREALLPLATKGLLEVLKAPPVAHSQDHSLATYAPKLESRDSFIDFQGAANSIFDRLRGCNPEPGSWCTVRHKGVLKKLKILKAKLLDSYEPHQPGAILTWDKKKGIIVGCTKGSIGLLSVQLEGKKPVEATAFALGYPQTDIQFVITD